MASPYKRQKLNGSTSIDPAEVRLQRESFLSSLQREVSPPHWTRNRPAGSWQPQAETVHDYFHGAKGCHGSRGASPRATLAAAVDKGGSERGQNINLVAPSPFRLTTVRDLPPCDNVDTLSLHDMLGNPLIKEAWIFNFCFDVDWTMEHFDRDVRDLVQVKIIHGSWRREDTNKMAIDLACARWPNVKAATAYLPDPFGTHHSKMFVLFCHDDTAEVIIHTANMLAKDWTNMTQAAWRSGPLHQQNGPDDQAPAPIGSGSRFKQDLLAYLKAYNKPCKDLHSKLASYSFDTVRAALIASVPSKIKVKTGVPGPAERVWGWPQLKQVLGHVHSSHGQKPTTSQPHLVAQVSSIASLNKGWLENLVDALSSGSSTPSFSIIYPTPANVASSLDGYAAGGSIHTKAQSAAHLKQIASLRPHLCQWTGGKPTSFRSGRHQAAPHIKTYVQYGCKPTEDTLSSDNASASASTSTGTSSRSVVDIDWALLTSANLSMQAWGSLPRGGGGGGGGGGKDESHVHIQSYEIGVLVWPALFGANSRMMPVFGKDLPDESPPPPPSHGQQADMPVETVVGFRMPYDLPLVAYGPNELPWSAHSTYTKPDSLGRRWPPTER